MLKLWMIEIVLCMPNVRFIQSMNFLLRGLVIYRCHIENYIV